MGAETKTSQKAKLVITIVVLQCCYAGFHIITRVALNLGVSKIVFLVYRNIIAIVLLAPFAYFLEKKDRRPLTFSLLVQFFLLALCGITVNQGFYIVGLFFLSPTYASAIQNSVPAITFAMAAALRLEQVNIYSRYGLAKVAGIVVSIVGASTITLYKGPPLPNHQTRDTLTSSEFVNWTWGCICILGNCLATSAWMVLQVPVLKQYPAMLSVTTFTCLFALIQMLVVAAFMQTDIDEWKIHSGGELWTILYAGLVGSGICFSLQTYCIGRGGPLFAAVFIPVQTVAVAIVASIVLGDQLYSGGLIGTILIMIGLYFVLWGKSQEKVDTNNNLTTCLIDEAA